jgi:hypothetical protein
MTPSPERAALFVVLPVALPGLGVAVAEVQGLAPLAIDCRPYRGSAKAYVDLRRTKSMELCDHLCEAFQRHPHDAGGAADDLGHKRIVG